MFGYSYSLTSRFAYGGISVGGGLTAAPFASVNADGWSAQYATTPPTFAPNVSPVYFDIDRAGFDTTGAACRYVDSAIVTKRVREPVQLGGLVPLTPFRVACSTHIYQGDNLSAGVSNGSLMTSPKPVANWALADQELIGDTLYGEITVWHRNFRAGGRHVAVVKVWATDGTNTTPIVLVTVPAPSIRTSDKNPVTVYRYTLDTSGLFPGSAGVVRVDAEVYPWLGTAASVLKTSDYSAARDFSTRYYWKDTPRFLNPPRCYVSSSGSDTTGSWGLAADDATLRATPSKQFASALGAIAAVSNATLGTPYTNNYVDGARIRIMTGTVTMGTNATAKTSKGCSVIIEADPLAPVAANCNLTIGSSVRPRFSGVVAPMVESSLRISGGLTVTRTAAGSFLGETVNKLRFILDGGVSFNWGSLAGTMFSNSHGYIQGATILNPSSNCLGVTVAGEYRLMRGLAADVNGGTVDGWLLLGCTLTRPTLVSARSAGVRSDNRAIRAYNRYLRVTSPGGFDNIGSDENLPDGFVRAVNLFEYLGGSNKTGSTTNADGATGSVNHVIDIGNTGTGFFSDGRWNINYEDFQSAAPERSSTLCVFAGNLIPQFNIKGDRFCYSNESLSLLNSQARVHNWPTLYGVDCFGNYTSFADAQGGTPATGGSFSPEFFGMGSVTGASSVAPTQAMAQLFVDYEGPTGVSVAGIGSGSYLLPAGSAAIGIVPRAVSTHDLLGLARPATADSAGCYRA